MTLETEAEQNSENLEPLTREEEIAALEGQPAEGGDEESTTEEDAQATDTEDASEVSISFDDETTTDESPGTETPVIRTLRGENKQLVRRVRELEAKLKTPAQTAPVQEEIGPKPTLADCDYDEAAFEAKLDEWKSKKASIDRRKQQQEEQTRKQNEAYQEKRNAYKTAAAGLGVKDFEDAEAQAAEVFNNVQQSILVKHMTQPAALIYALGRSPSKAKELAAIADPIEFALAAAKLEEKHLKVTPRKTAPPPERQLKGSGKTQAVTSAHIDSLKKKAQESGDYTAYFAAKRQKETAT